MSAFIDGTIKGYLGDLSARSIVPGGGSVAALTAALGAGLNLMVINYSMRKDVPASEQDILSRSKDRQQRILQKLTDLVDEDCKVFQNLMKTLSSGTDTQKEYEEAAAAPLAVCVLCAESMDITSQIVKQANKHLISDIGSAAHMLKAAFCSAQINVEVNLEHIKDEKVVDRLREEAVSAKEKIERAGAAILSQIS